MRFDKTAAQPVLERGNDSILVWHGFSSTPYGFPLSTSADPIGITGDWMG